MSARSDLLKSLSIPFICLSLILYLSARVEGQTPDSSPVPTPPLSTPAPATTAQTPTVTSDTVQKRIEQLKEVKDLSEENQKKALDFYNQSLNNLKKTADFQADATKYSTLAQNAMQRLEAKKTEIENLNKKPAPTFTENQTLPQLEQLLVQEEAELEQDKTAASSWDEEVARRSNRQKEALTRVTELDDKISELEKQLKLPIPADEPASITDARRMELFTRLNMRKAEKPALKSELTAYEAEETIGFPRTNQDFLKLEVKKQTELVDALKAQIKKLRNREAAMRVKEAKRQVFKTNPLLQPLAEKNQNYAEEIVALNKKIESTDKKYSQTTKILEDLKKQFDQTKAKEELIGLTGPIGLMLRNQQANLPDIENRIQDIEKYSKTIDQVNLKQFELDEAWDDFPSVDEVFDEIRDNSQHELTEEEELNLKNVIEETLSTQKEYLDTLIRSNKSYFSKLLDIYTTEQQLVKETEKYSDYIQERIFWIKSSPPISFSEIKQTSSTLRWLFSPTHWKQLFIAVQQDVVSNPVIYFTAVFCFLSLLYLAYNVRQQLRIINKEIIRSSFRKFGITARVAFLTLFIAIVWPGFIWFIAWRVGSHPDVPPFVKAVDNSLRQVGWLLFFWELIRQICRPLGLGESHFGWYKQTVLYVRKNIRWVIPFSIPLLFITLLLHGKEVDRTQDLLERLFFTALLVVYTIFARRVFHPRSGLFQSIMNYNHEVWYDRLKYVVYFLTLFVPCLLIFLALIGFYFTAMSLFHLIFLTLWLFLVVVLFRAILLRWILIHHRKLSYQQNQERMDAIRKESLESSSETNIAGITTEEENPADLTKISAQIKKLVNASMVVILLVGAFWIWGDTLPAFNRLDSGDYKVWTTTVEVVGDDGKIIERLEPVTYLDFGIAIILAVFAIVATNNAPGLLEFLVLQRLPLDASVKYAITTLARYFVSLIGIFVVFSTMGIGWTKLQWLATALTFGLGFGLQEIFANFVSGLILLIERPIRVGDIITVDEITGIVSRIRMRATTITNWDRKEYIVPNRDFITGKLLNWTLTDSVNRITITVGVAYGSDTNHASDIALKILMDHPLILEDPPPSITFESFGDSTLNLILRAYLPDLEKRLVVIHQIHTSIHEQYAKAGIEIAFPQRDIHLYYENQSSLVPPPNLDSAEPESPNPDHEK
ncbi:mechanosensitive ion channel domain-containing protein [Gimesia maris]|uniref:mechanosensitive ion channel domain-containing protein n=1 Tax=Gimesia maris TaxID=122 RepID=UPI0024202FF5|nr:mechanosensitive ion channel domain-containing protein [Gimesia maris]|tara:strand:- start:71253 stop:74765 length:3513 start_codon:yes stop_codon:yes gene_type:complete